MCLLETNHFEVHSGSLSLASAGKKRDLYQEVLDLLEAYRESHPQRHVEEVES
jgi:hypothetical protein